MGTYMHPPGPYRVYVRAVLGGPVTGITGAEFRLVGLPADWTMAAIAAADAAVVIGDPTLSGANIAFAACQSQPCKTLFQVLIYPGSEAPWIWLRPERSNPPSNPAFTQPVLTMCDAPFYTAVLVPGGAICINAPGCSVPVSRTSWTGVKELFR